jgi:hypothetical protein
MNGLARGGSGRSDESGARTTLDLASGSDCGWAHRSRHHAFGVFIIVIITHYGNGDSPYSGIFVNNRTQFNLTIYLHMHGQEPIPAARVPSHSRVGTDITCGSQEMTAEDAAGHVIARRRPLPACDESDWVISETSSLEDPSSVAG